MLRSTKDLENCTIGATDGNIGHVTDFYFDDQRWVVRYFIVDAGSWLSSRKVLISPSALGHPNWSDKILPVRITQDQVRQSPDIDTEKPVSRQHEKTLLGHYGLADYWEGPGLWEGGIYPDNSPISTSAPESTSLGDESGSANTYATSDGRPGRDDPHLRSCSVVTGYHIQATDGEVGRIHSFLVDDETWAIRYIIVATGEWWSGHEVLIPPQWIQAVSWRDSTVTVSLTQQAIKDAPTYDAHATLDREWETEIYKHYGRPGYWVDATPQGRKSASVLLG